MTTTPSPDPALPWASSVIIRTEVGSTAHGTGLPGGVDYDELGVMIEPWQSSDAGRLLVAGDTHGNLPWIGTLSKLAKRCDRSIAQVLRAFDATRPQLVMHGHYHRRWSGLMERPWGNVRVEGIASDMENYVPGESWAILDLADLSVAPR